MPTLTALPLVEVSTRLTYPDGEPATGLLVTASLQSAAQNDDGYIIERDIDVISDENGCVIFNLWPNCDGIEETFYRIIARDKCLGELLNAVAIIPESATPINLEDVALSINSLGLGQSSGNVASVRRIDTGEGLTGGGDLSTNRTHEMDLTTIVNEETTPLPSWIIPVQDPNVPANIRYARLSSLPGLNTSTISIEEIATAGQTEILIQNNVSASIDSTELYIEGIRQPPTRYTREIVNLPPYNFRITLSEALEGGEEIEVVLKQNCDVGSGIDSADITYSGGGSVEDALNTLFTTSGSSPFEVVDGNQTLQASDRVFVDTSPGPLVFTLPCTPSFGDTIEIIDITPSSAITGGDLDNDFTVARNGNLIMEVASDLIVDQARISFKLIFAGATFGWRLVE